MSMSRSQFKRRLKRARRASQRLANERSQPVARPDGAARWIAMMADLQRAQRAGQPRPVIPCRSVTSNTHPRTSSGGNA